MDRILNKFNYYKVEEPEGAVVTEEEIYEMFKTYGQSELFSRFLRDLCDRDVKAYFQAVDDTDRNKLRGAWSRTNYFTSLIQKSNDKRKQERRGS